MSRLLFLLSLAAAAALSVNAPSAAWLGGPDARPLTPRRQAQEQALKLARRLHALRGPDGWHLRVTDPGEADPWGNPLDVEYERGFGYEALRVRGRGPDGVWGTEDDVAVSLLIFQRADRESRAAAR